MLTFLRVWMALPLSGLPLFSLASAVISRISVYATLILAAHFLNQEDFGVYSILLALIGLLSALISGGGDMWLNRFSWQSSARAQEAPRLWPVYINLVMLLAIGVTGIAIIVDFSVPAFTLHRSEIAIAILTAAAVGVTEALLAILRASGSVKLFFVIRDVAAPLLLLAAILVLRPPTASSILTLYLLMWVALCLLIAVRLLWRAPATLPTVRAPRAAWRPVALHTGGLIFGNLTSRLSLYVDSLVLTAFVGMALLGEYRVAAQFAIGFMVAQHFVFLGLPWQMRLTAPFADSGVGHSIVLQRQQFFIALGTLILVVLWFFTDVVLGLLGPRFVIMANVFRILLLIRFASLLWGPQHEVLVSSGLSIQDALANVVALMAWLVSFFLFFFFLFSRREPVTAAISANLISAFSGHLYRHIIMQRRDMPKVHGHPFGLFLPIAIYLFAGWLALRGAIPQ